MTPIGLCIQKFISQMGHRTEQQAAQIGLKF